jgi:hypothetical protein
LEQGQNPIFHNNKELFDFLERYIDVAGDWWNDFENSPYVFTSIHQKQKPSPNSYNPFLKAISDNVWREHWGNRIYLSEKEFLRETQTSYRVISNDVNEDLLKEFAITQNENGIDTENRIEKMRRILDEMSNN